MCKSHKDQRRKDCEQSQTWQERRARVSEKEQVRDAQERADE